MLLKTHAAARVHEDARVASRARLRRRQRERARNAAKVNASAGASTRHRLRGGNGLTGAGTTRTRVKDIGGGSSSSSPRGAVGGVCAASSSLSSEANPRAKACRITVALERRAPWRSHRGYAATRESRAWRSPRGRLRVDVRTRQPPEELKSSPVDSRPSSQTNLQKRDPRKFIHPDVRDGHRRLGTLIYAALPKNAGRISRACCSSRASGESQRQSGGKVLAARRTGRHASDGTPTGTPAPARAGERRRSSNRSPSRRTGDGTVVVENLVPSRRSPQ